MVTNTETPALPEQVPQESPTDDPIYENLRKIGEPEPDDQIVHQRYVAFHIIKFLFFIPFCYYMSKFYTMSKLVNAISDICRAIGNLCCLMVTNPLLISGETLLSTSSESAAKRIPFTFESPTWKCYIYHIGVVVSDVFTPVTKVTKVTQQIAVVSVIYWFTHWREFETQAAAILDSYMLFFGSLRFGIGHFKRSVISAWRNKPQKVAQCIHGLMCGYGLILMEFYSLYYIYSLV